MRVNRIVSASALLVMWATVPPGSLLRAQWAACGSSGPVQCAPGGNVGIGTTTPSWPLDIALTSTGLTGLRIENYGSGSSAQTQVNLVNAQYGESYYGVSDGSFTGYGPLNGGTAFLGGYLVPVSIFTQSAADIFFSPNGTEAMRIKSGGNVGIGATNPAGRLHVAATTGVASPGSIALAIRDSGSPTYGFDFDLEGVSTGDLSLMRTVAGAQSQVMTFQRATGNVGIGTKNPPYLLSVKGPIGAGEVVVTNTSGWPDYVFDPGYRLAPLSEVASYVKENHHLPEIPSAKDVEEKGLSLGEMQSKLLAKIEELTLHMIRAEERSDRIERENEQLRREVKQLEARSAR